MVWEKINKMAKDMKIRVYDDQVKIWEEHEDDIQDLIQLLLDSPEKIKEIIGSI